MKEYEILMTKQWITCIQCLKKAFFPRHGINSAQFTEVAIACDIQNKDLCFNEKKKKEKIYRRFGG